MGLAVFLEPRGELHDAILRWKTKVSKIMPEEPYCSHPPHCTLFHTEVKFEKKALARLKNILAKTEPFELEVHGTEIFWEDVLTGGHTLYLRITSDRKLNDLQLNVAKSLKNLIHKTSLPALLKNNPVLKKSFENYGSPFIGDHWIPHLSIASMRTEKSHPLISEFQSWQPKYNLKVNELSFWRVNGNDHLLIERFRF